MASMGRFQKTWDEDTICEYKRSHTKTEACNQRSIGNYRIMETSNS